MKRNATGTFSLDRWDEEQPYLDEESVKLTRAHIEKGRHSYTLDYELD